MAITRSQIAKQLLANGGRTGLRGGGADFSNVKTTAGTDNTNRGYSSNVSPSSSTAGVTESNRRSGGQDASNFNRDTGYNPNVSPSSTTANEVFNIMSTGGDTPFSELTGQEKNQLNRAFFISKPSNYPSYTPTSLRFAGDFNRDINRKYFIDNVVRAGKIPGLNYGTLSEMSEDDIEQEYKDYMSDRLAGNIDAMGNPLNTGGDDNIILPVDTTFNMESSNTDQETEEPFEIARRFRAEGGIMNSDVVGGEYDFDSARQMYGLGKLVKKIGRSVKKIAKSPIGKAALLYAGTAGLGAFGAGAARAGTGLGIFSPSNVLSNVGTSFLKFKGSPIGEKIFGTAVGDTDMKRSGGLFDLIKKNPFTAITAASTVAGLLTADQEAEAQKIADETGIDIAEIRANPDKYLARRFRAEGGSMDEPVAKKTMPLLDMDGQEMDLRAEGGFVPIGRMEKADDVPARLSKNEFVFTAEAVRNAGEGDVDKGAEVMYNMMKNLESGGEVSEESQGLEGAREMFQTSQRLEEVI